ncbi:MAG: hypothetical protein PUI24_06980, partial [Spirochaetales bacterium]|nr:hypothetical protein [Spirochaetales bacterium]
PFFIRAAALVLAKKCMLCEWGFKKSSSFGITCVVMKCQKETPSPDCSGCAGNFVAGAQQVWSVSGRPAVRVSHEKRVMPGSKIFFQYALQINKNFNFYN